MNLLEEIKKLYQKYDVDASSDFPVKSTRLRQEELDEDEENRRFDVHGLPEKVLGPGEWNEVQLKNALECIAPGCKAEDIVVMVDDFYEKKVQALFNRGRKSCTLGMVITEDAFWDNEVADCMVLEDDFQMPLHFADIDYIDINTDPDCDYPIRLFLKDGSIQEIGTDGYVLFTYEVLKTALKYYRQQHPEREAPRTIFLTNGDVWETGEGIWVDGRALGGPIRPGNLVKLPYWQKALEIKAIDDWGEARYIKDGTLASLLFARSDLDKGSIRRGQKLEIIRV